MLTRVVLVALLLGVTCTPHAAGWWHTRETVLVQECPVVTYRSLKPLLKRIDYGVVPIEKAMDSCDFPPSLLKRTLQLDEDVLHVGMEMIAKELPPETIQRHLCETERELQQVSLDVACYQATHCMNRDCYIVTLSSAWRSESSAK